MKFERLLGTLILHSGDCVRIHFVSKGVVDISPDRNIPPIPTAPNTRVFIGNI